MLLTTTLLIRCRHAASLVFQSRVESITASRLKHQRPIQHRNIRRVMKPAQEHVPLVQQQ